MTDGGRRRTKPLDTQECAIKSAFPEPRAQMQINQLQEQVHMQTTNLQSVFLRSFDFNRFGCQIRPVGNYLQSRGLDGQANGPIILRPALKLQNAPSSLSLNPAASSSSPAAQPRSSGGESDVEVVFRSVNCVLHFLNTTGWNTHLALHRDQSVIASKGEWLCRCSMSRESWFSLSASNPRPSSSS